MVRRSAWILGVALLTIVGVGVSSAVPYYLTDLGPAGGDTLSLAYAVSLVGGAPTTVGFSQDIIGTGNIRTPVRWNSNGTATSLLSSIPAQSAGAGNQANGIAPTGDIVGQTIVGGVQSAFYIPNGGSGTVLPALGGTGASSTAGVSTTGTVVGYSVATDGHYHAFAWSSSTGTVDLGASGIDSYAAGISADGSTIVGDWDNTPGQQGVACKWTKSGSTWTRTDLISKSVYNQSVALAINSSGDIVGSLFNYPDGGFPNPDVRDLLIKHDGTVVNLNGYGALTPDWHFAYARGINDSGVIVGSDGTLGPALVNYTGIAGADIDLSTLLAPSAAGWTLSYAYGIDNNGNIAGRGKNPAGITHGYLLKPALAGDANLDGVVNINDLSKVLTNYDKSGLQWADGDFDGNGTVNISDLSKVLTNYDKSAGASAAGIAAVPEPATFVLVATGILGMLLVARRRG